MFVTMLTHLHMVVYTWWCWHIYKGGGVPRVERGVFGAFEKIKCMFYIAPVGNLEKSWECFLPRNTHRTLMVAAPDAGPERPVWCLWLRCAERTERWHRTLGGYCSSVRWCAMSASACEVFLISEHRTLRVRPVACVR